LEDLSFSGESKKLNHKGRNHMADSVQRDVFKIENQNKAFRFGAKFLAADGPEEKWSGEIPEMIGVEQGQLIGRIITNSEGKEYKINKITGGNPEDKNHYHQNLFWIEKI
jgi:hypothetical protein